MGFPGKRFWLEEENIEIKGGGIYQKMHEWKSFYRDSSSYLHEFQRKPRKTPNG